MIHKHLFLFFAIALTTQAMETSQQTKEQIAAHKACLLLNASEDDDIEKTFIKLFTADKKKNDDKKKEIIKKLVQLKT